MWISSKPCKRLALSSSVLPLSPTSFTRPADCTGVPSDVVTGGWAGSVCGVFRKQSLTSASSKPAHVKRESPNCWSLQFLFSGDSSVGAANTPDPIAEQWEQPLHTRQLEAIGYGWPFVQNGFLPSKILSHALIYLNYLSYYQLIGENTKRPRHITRTVWVIQVHLSQIRAIRSINHLM